MSEPYYLAYEKRYRAVYAAGADRWGHAADDPVLRETLRAWVADNGLCGKRVIEYACGEGAAGVILSELGCRWHGADVSPTAVEKARDALREWPGAEVSLLDMVRETAESEYDAALDCMGLHMLVTDGDRAAYLANAHGALKDGAPMLFFRESYRRGEEAYPGAVETYDAWKRISGADYETPEPREARAGNGTVTVMIPLIAARARSREGYTAEMEKAGFTVERFVETGESNAVPFAASIFVRKRTT